MLQGVKGVKYGLTVPDSKKKKKPALGKPAACSAFGDDGSDEDQHEAVPQQLARHAASKKSDSKVKGVHAAALAEDPSVFDYDGVYDSMQETKAAPVAAARAQRSSKYIENLLDKAKERQREQDIIYERRQVKEREVEDHLFGDKEKFVTAAYKKKLQEQKLWEAQQKLKDDEDEANAAEKKGDMSNFYGNLMTKNVAFGGTSKPAKTIKAEAGTASSLAAAAASDPAAAATEAAAAPVRSADGITQSAAEQDKPSAASQQSDAEAGGLKEGRREIASARAVEGAASARHQPSSTAAGSVPVDAEVAPAAEAPAKLSVAKHTDADAAAAARERYLARKRKASSDPSAT
eukprot:CAMPEP_0206148508 /NCGR_PEP_ID=MMETSP1473-20131121/36815_1 /ASSEMBLY_ACC=CAM_ASM_001109 /TAXON_ID=1461547 /ORGANISM="Stichococcus sp, Strain RCC1054" /LENGTH=347 /DNA_ID=CAMNT_0053545865 /DNA_START=174 /DNA_END=1217 /DNA_ORIENTATION=-